MKKKKLIKAHQAKKEKAQHSPTIITSNLSSEDANLSLTHDSIQCLELGPSEYVHDFLSNTNSSPFDPTFNPSPSNPSSFDPTFNSSSFDPTFNSSSFNHTSDSSMNSTLDNPILSFSDSNNESFSLDVTNLESDSLMPVLGPKAEKIKNELIKKINYLPEKELHSCYQLLMNMVYPDGPHKDEILSPYLQKKAMEWISTMKGKPNSSAMEMEEKITELEKENRKLEKRIQDLASKKKSLAIKVKCKDRIKETYLSQICSVVCKRRNINSEDFNKKLIGKIKQNKKAYTPEFIAMATNLSTFGQMSLASTVESTREIMSFLTGEQLNSFVTISTLY